MLFFVLIILIAVVVFSCLCSFVGSMFLFVMGIAVGVVRLVDVVFAGVDPVLVDLLLHCCLVGVLAQHT